MGGAVILLETLVNRWYAWAFVALLLWAVTAERGVARALRFWGIASFVALLAEVVGSETGFPYGGYDYVSRIDEIHLLTVPIFVPLSFGVVVWAGRALATAGYGARSAGTTIVGGAVIAAVLDLVIDPMTLRGAEWFMGPLYTFDARGGWFGVPWSNFGGWVLVSATVLWLDEVVELRERRAVEPVRGPLLAAIICGFFLLLALFTGNLAIFAGSLIVSVGVLGAAWPGIARTYAAASAADEEPGG